MPTDQANQTRDQQQAFAQSLQGQAAGTAPSVAQAQLGQAVNAQNAQAATALGSQRGINPALAARLIAQQQAQNTQGMAGQAVTSGIQERQAAQGLLGSALQAQRGQDIGQAQGQVQAGLGQAQVGNQQMATTQQAIAAQNAALMGQQQQNNQIGYNVAAGNQQAANSFLPGLLGGAGAAATGLGLMGGGTPNLGGTGQMVGGGQFVGQSLAEGGKVRGKAKVAGDSLENDTVPIMASPGEVVLPRTVAQDPDKAKEFVAHLRKSAKSTPSSSKASAPSYGDVVKSHKALEERLKKLEHLCYGGPV